MKLVICGGRNYIFNKGDVEFLDKFCEEYKVSEVVSGGARGADNCGEMYAVLRGIPRRRFVADWNKDGKYNPMAGRERNVQMAEYADGCVGFPGGKGTRHMIETARAMKLVVVEVDNSGS